MHGQQNIKKRTVLRLLGIFPSMISWLVHYSGIIHQTPTVNSTKIFEITS
jgi:hypothetical protein